MKKLLTLSLILFALAIVGCSKPVSQPVAAELKNGNDMFCFDDARWGMNIADACSALNIPQADLLKIEDKNIYEYDGYEYQGVKTKILLYFTSESDSHGKLYPSDILHRVVVHIKDAEHEKKIVDTLNEQYGKHTTAPLNTSVPRWNSAEKVNSYYQNPEDYSRFLSAYEKAIYEAESRKESDISKRLPELDKLFADTPLFFAKIDKIGNPEKSIVTFDATAFCFTAYAS